LRYILVIDDPIVSRPCHREPLASKRFSGIEKQAVRKLDMLHHARDIGDLRAPPANRLEALTGDRRGQHWIRINDQWRICFTWTKEGPEHVEIVDYH
jgi:proteic killer suppression protein